MIGKLKTYEELKSFDAQWLLIVKMPILIVRRDCYKSLCVTRPILKYFDSEISSQRPEETYSVLLNPDS